MNQTAITLPGRQQVYSIRLPGEMRLRPGWRMSFFRTYTGFTAKLKRLQIKNSFILHLCTDLSLLYRSKMSGWEKARMKYMLPTLKLWEQQPFLIRMLMTALAE